jgi:ATP-dependent DNA helicase RecG
MNPVQLERLLYGLCRLSGEREWVEFKENNDEPEMIGETVSALSNAARLRGEPYGYLVWGVRDGSHEIVGTAFSPSQARKGNEELEHWLVRMLTPRLDLRFYMLPTPISRWLFWRFRRRCRHLCSSPVRNLSVSVV